jgi:hypothetical protein
MMFYSHQQQLIHLFHGKINIPLSTYSDNNGEEPRGGFKATPQDAITWVERFVRPFDSAESFDPEFFNPVLTTEGLVAGCPLRAGINPAPTDKPHPTGRGGIYPRPRIG